MTESSRGNPPLQWTLFIRRRASATQGTPPGKDDMMVPTINSYILQQHLPDARLILYPDSGHGSHFQFPEVFAEEAARFFAAV